MSQLLELITSLCHFKQKLTHNHPGGEEKGEIAFAQASQGCNQMFEIIPSTAQDT